MSNTKVTDQLNQIAKLIANNPQGVGFESVANAITNISRRTLQRRLATLVQQQRLTTTGVGRALKYFVPLSTTERPSDDNCRIEAEVYVPLSVEAQDIKRYVKQPRQQRKPASYKTDFLEQYHPNQTYYLPTDIREQFHSLGRSPTHTHTHTHTHTPLS